MMLRSSIISLICFYLLVECWLLERVVAVTGAGIGTAGEFGTKDGYDVGGTRPICYATNIPKDPNVPDTDGSNYTAIELLNDGLYGHNQELSENKTSSGSSVSLLSSVRYLKVNGFRFSIEGIYCTSSLYFLILRIT